MLSALKAAGTSRYGIQSGHCRRKEVSAAMPLKPVCSPNGLYIGFLDAALYLSCFLAKGLLRHDQWISRLELSNPFSEESSLACNTRMGIMPWLSWPSFVDAGSWEACLVEIIAVRFCVERVEERMLFCIDGSLWCDLGTNLQITFVFLKYANESSSCVPITPLFLMIGKDVSSSHSITLTATPSSALSFSNSPSFTPLAC
nr:hypothetical protein Iba_chr03cCG13710 [Ipomoea batatas]